MCFHSLKNSIKPLNDYCIIFCCLVKYELEMYYGKYSLRSLYGTLHFTIRTKNWITFTYSTKKTFNKQSPNLIFLNLLV